MNKTFSIILVFSLLFSPSSSKAFSISPCFAISHFQTDDWRLKTGDCFIYDGDGNRIQKTDTTGHSTQYIYDGLNTLIEQEGSTRTQYTNAPHLDEVLSRYTPSSPSTEYYYSDGLGSVSLILDNTGYATKSYTYDAWGNITSELGTSPNARTYTSREENRDIGLMYYRARYYDPTIGRFISQDPFSGGPDDARIGYENNIYSKFHGEATLYTAFRKPNQFNRYIYVQNNPLRYTDPLGMDASDVADKIDSGIDGLLDSGATTSVAANTVMEVAGQVVKGTVDIMRFGEGIAGAVYGDGDILDKAAGIARDVARAASLGAIVGGFNAKFNKVSTAEEASGKIEGYTRHGLNQAISRDGGKGVHPEAILDAVRNPLKTSKIGKTTKYKGKKATVVLNKQRQVVTTWGKQRTR